MQKKASFWTITVVLILFTFLALPMGVSAADYPYGINATGQYPFTDGDGTKDDPFLISTPQQLAQLAYNVAQDISYQDQYLKLTANLDLSGVDWLPIGASATEEFMGDFDGNNKTISNLSIGSAATPCNLEEVGLFGYVSYAAIHNLKIENAAVYSSLPDYYGDIGILAGEVNDTDFFFCSVSGMLSSSSRSGSCVGGLIGSIDYTEKYSVIGCSAAVDITVSSEYDGDVGGLIGESNASVIACSASGNISGKGYLGGLVGNSNADIVDCFATGNISSSQMAGGLVGDNDGNIYNSYATGTVHGYSYSGGLVGYHSYFNLIANSDATGNVSAGSGSGEAGGLVGSCSGSMINSYAAGQVTNGQGLTDYLYAGGTYAPATAVNCFWNSTLNITGGAGIGKTTLEMQNPSFLLLLNDPALEGRKPIFRDWIIVSGVNNGMPIIDGVGPMNTTKPVISAASAAHHLAAAAEISFDSDMLGEFYYAVVASGADAPDIDTGGSGSLCYEGENEYTIPAVTGAWDIYIVVKGLNGKESNPVKIELSAEPALFAGGTGTKNDPYQIATAYHLHNVRYFLDDHFIMMDDIDLDPDLLDDAFWYDPALGWDPIGSGDTEEPPFDGQFDGNGKKVKNMTITFSNSTGYSSGDIGLFGYVNTDAAIFDLGIVSCDLSSTYYGGGAGGLAGTLYGTMDHCYATGSISVGAINAGGLVGNNYSASIINSWANMDIESIGWSHVGGLVGYNNGTIRNCGASGSIQGGNGTRAGGLTGFNQSYYNQSTIQNGYAAGAVSGNGWGFVGPFYGENQENFSGASFKDCYWNEDATITATENGGQTPTVHGSTSNCLAKGSDYMKSQDFVDTLNDGLPQTSGYYEWEIIEGINDGYPILKAELTEDTLSPTVANNTISVSSITSSGGILSWNEATDNITDAQNLQYCVYRSSSNNIGSVTDMEANATAISDFAYRSTYTVTGLAANQTYYFNIIVKDEEGNKTAYKTASLTTAANPLDTYQITATANTGGTITPPGNSVVTRSDSITFTIQADAGYVIKDVLVDGVSVGAVSTYTFSSMKANHSIEARFKHDCPAKQFTDVDITQWYHEGIDFVLLAGLFVGTSETKFSPNADMTRAMLVTVVWRLEQEPPANATNPFTDVPGDTWYTEAVIWAAEIGVVKGYDQDTFGTKDPITREQMATILHRYATIKGYDISAADSLNQFTDAGKVSSWAADAVKWTVAEGLINGVKAATLDPGGKASRAQVATILMRFIKPINK